MTTIGGNGKKGCSDGFASDAQFGGPRGVAIDNYNNIIVADTDNSKIRMLSRDR